MTTGQTTNWAGNVSFHHQRFHRPDSLTELRRIVAGSARLRVLGTGHSFSPIADTDGDLVSLAGLPPTIEIDPDRRTVTVAAGLRYGEVATRLHAAGFALHNLASLPHISVGGACATGTHGSGERHGSLATAVAAMRLVTADGDLLTVERDADGDRFAGMVVALGALGVVTHLSLDLLPAFEVRQYVYEGLPLEVLGEHAAEVLGGGYSVSLFSDWTGPRFKQVWLKRRVDGDDGWVPPRQWMGATLADGPRHPIAGMPVENCTEQLGVPGPWYERLPHFRLGFVASSGAELQSEYFVPRERAVEALAALDGIRDRIAPVLQVSEIRTIAADDFWLSPTYRRDSVGVHFTWIFDPDAVAPVVAAVESLLVPLGARPHWAKVFTIEPAVVRRAYQRLPDFLALRDELDPAGTFGNDWVRRYLTG